MTDADRIAWIFLAVWFWDKNPVTRLEVIHSADELNQLEPEDSDIDLAVAFLTRHHLLKAEGDQLTITGAGQEVLSAANHGVGNIFETWKALEVYFFSMGAI